MKMQRCKGTKDLTPAEMAVFRVIEDTFRQVALSWGYGEVRTPVLEYLHLFTTAGTLTPSMLSRVYSFLDWDGWSGERVVLRPDCTIPVARLYVDSLAETGARRLFYVANSFIFEETGQESRERWQGGAELIGPSSPLSKVELIMMARQVLSSLGIGEVSLKLSHAGLIRELLIMLGLKPKEQHRVFEQILDGDIDSFEGIKPGKGNLKRLLPRLLELRGESAGYLKNLRASLSGEMEGLQAPLNDFIAVAELLEAVGCPYEVDIASGSGFEYYTGLIFQFYAGGRKIGGGGRYDALIPTLGGEDTPAAGFALYFDRLMELVKEQVAPPTPPVTVCLCPEAASAGFSLAAALREAGYRAVFEIGDGPAGTPEPPVIEVKAQSPCFTLRLGGTSAARSADTVAGIIKVLRG